MEKVINARISVKPEAIEQFISFAEIIIEAEQLRTGMSGL